jgi:hypothetical protein
MLFKGARVKGVWRDYDPNPADLDERPPEGREYGPHLLMCGPYSLSETSAKKLLLDDARMTLNVLHRFKATAEMFA